MGAAWRLVAAVSLLVAHLAGQDGAAAWAEFSATWPRVVADPAGSVAFVQLASRLARDLPAHQASEAAFAAGLIARRIHLAPGRLPGDDALGVVDHVVRSGERLETIARRYRMSVRWLTALNPQVGPSTLRVGQRLKAIDVASEPIQVVISVEHFLLMAWRGQHLLHVAKVGLGTADRPTPRGETTIALSVANPEWRDPATGKVHKPGAPGNILGGWWLGFAPGADGRFKSIGMHGYTGSPSADWMGKPGSRGCVRLRQEDLAVVAALLLPGTRVSVR